MFFFCATCGWGGDRIDEAESGYHDEVESDGGGKLWLKLIASWIFSIAFMVGPYIALVHYFPDIRGWVHGLYWVGMATYIMAASTTTPRYDDTRMYHNPFSYEDDHNRAMHQLALMLLPGKIIWFAIVLTWSMTRGEKKTD